MVWTRQTLLQGELKNVLIRQFGLHPRQDRRYRYSTR